jgi:DNA-binding NtrC family response regulator
MQVLMDYGWPGNVRELENAVERAVVLSAQPNVPLEVLPEHVLHSSGIRIRRDASGYLPADASLFEIVADFERRKIMETLEASNWSQTEAAEALHIPLSTLNQKIKRLEIPIPKKSEVRAPARQA